MFTRSLSRKLSTLTKAKDAKLTIDLSKKLFVLHLNNPANKNDLPTVNYEKHDNVYVLSESYVPESFRGLGIGKILAKKTFDYVVANNGKMILECEFLQKVYSENPNPYKKFMTN